MASDDDKPRSIVKPDEALVRRAATTPAPPMKLANSLEEAAPRTFVHVDSKGEVRSPARYKALQAASYGAAAAIVGGVTIMYGALLGVPGIGIGAAFAAYFGWHLKRGRMLHKATVLLVHDQLDEAEALLRKVLSSWRCPKHVRALAEQNLGAVYNRRGNFEEALAHQRAAMAIYARTSGRSPMRRVVEYAEIITLVNLGRVGEARQRLDQKHGQVPKGNYLRLQHWGAELYVCLAESEAEAAAPNAGERPSLVKLDSDTLHQCAIMALKITGAAALLGLTAWAHWKVGDTDQAWHLLREAYDRRSGVRLERSMPLLWKWMEAHADEAGVDKNAASAADADDDPLAGF
jgi:tetratricopeptide (TPR) repeat protein